MTLRDRILERKETLVRAWFERVLSTYPADSARLLGRNTDSFANPMGQTMMPALAAILEGLAAGSPPATIRAPLDAVVRIRAIQDFTPGVALVFLPQLKELIRAEAAKMGADADSAVAGELRELEDGIDGALLMAFDLYTACREQVHQLRTEQRWREAEMVTPGRPPRHFRTTQADDVPIERDS
jgi:hypothetical protein